MHPRLTVGLAAVALVVSACAMGGTTGDGSDRNRITREQIEGTDARTAYQAVEQLRPNWLTSRGPTSVTNPAPTVPGVFRDGSHVGSLSYLEQVQVAEVGELRYWPPGEASARFGMGYPRGVIEIISRTRTGR